jgi:hypothetical protein
LAHSLSRRRGEFPPLASAAVAEAGHQPRARFAPTTPASGAVSWRGRVWLSVRIVGLPFAGAMVDPYAQARRFVYHEASGAETELFRVPAFERRASLVQLRFLLAVTLIDQKKPRACLNLTVWCP